MDPTRPPKKSRIGERTMVACVPCKSRKLKCDGGIPDCENCIKTGRDCLVEDPATGLHRPRNYMQTLEARVSYLEGLLEQLHPGFSNDDASPVYTEDGKPPAQWPSTSATSTSPETNFTSHGALSDTSSIDHISSEVALLCLSAAGQEPRYFGPSSAVSFSHIASQTMGLKKAIRSSRSRIAQRPVTERVLSKRPVFTDWPLPERAAVLTSAYFTNIHPQYPFLHRPTFMKWQTECCAAKVGKRWSATSEISSFFVLMVYAIGSLAADASQSEAAETYYVAALEYLEPVLDLDGLESIQALLSIAVYSVRSPSGMSLWKVSGMAMRLCVQLGYHRNVEKYRSAGDVLTKEMSKRCFWVAYDLDRYVSCILGLPGAISDLSIDVELPLDVNDEDLVSTAHMATTPENSQTIMTGAIHNFKLRQIWSKFSSHLFPTSSLCSHDVHVDTGPSIEELRKEVEDWRASAPDLDSSPDTSPLSVFASQGWFQLAYDTSILLLYRHYIMDTKPYKCSPPLPKTPEIVNRAFEECYAKSKDMCLLYRRLYQNPAIQFTWGSLHMLFFGGLTYLYCLWRCKSIRDAARQRDVINTCMACQTVLVIIAERWKLATSYRDLFETLSERTISMVCGDLSVEDDAPPNAEASEEHESTAEQSAMSGLQDWTTEFDGLDLPLESEWLVSELMQGVHGSHSAESFDFADAALSEFEIQSGTGSLTTDWDVGLEPIPWSLPSYRSFK